MFAIRGAISEIINRKISTAVIISDSLNIISVRIIQALDLAKQLWLAIACIWLPAHSCIRGNKTADRLANEGKNGVQQGPNRAGPGELWHDVKRSLKSKWFYVFKKFDPQRG
ncbi:hypothetical protein HHI36_023824 [Cryptolaemus montrouzieri]|uniref:RNase H type-1 domain-containing protein n=1 Tax=Cryptolaemus montrouzieri TaxID=559131 RepID=A0ABD2PI04_9CUCU